MSYKTNPYYCYPSSSNCRNLLRCKGYDLDYYTVVQITLAECDSQGVCESGYYIWSKIRAGWLRKEYDILGLINGV